VGAAVVGELVVGEEVMCPAHTHITGNSVLQARLVGAPPTVSVFSATIAAKSPLAGSVHDPSLPTKKQMNVANFSPSHADEYELDDDCRVLARLKLMSMDRFAASSSPGVVAEYTGTVTETSAFNTYLNATNICANMATKPTTCNGVMPFMCWPSQDLTGLHVAPFFSVNRPVQGPTGTTIATSWTNLIRSTLTNSMVTAGVTGTTNNPRTGCAANGGYGNTAASTCTDWTTNIAATTANSVNPTQTTTGWLSSVAGLCSPGTSVTHTMMCICY
jgi:hypothetical protein